MMRRQKQLRIRIDSSGNIAIEIDEQPSVVEARTGEGLKLIFQDHRKERIKGIKIGNYLPRSRRQSGTNPAVFDVIEAWAKKRIRGKAVAPGELRRELKMEMEFLYPKREELNPSDLGKMIRRAVRRLLQGKVLFRGPERERQGRAKMA